MHPEHQPLEKTWGSKQIPLRFDKYPIEDAAYEPEVTNVIERFVEPGDCVIDAGACIGFHTCFMAKLVGEQGLVLAFEPELESFRYLAHHVHVANKLNNVACLRMALWKHDCSELKLGSIGHVGYSSIFPTMQPKFFETVEGRSLDSLLVGQNHPRLIKLDCEGAEGEILFGAHDTLARGVDCVILEFNYQVLTHTGRSDRAIREYMADLGYEMFLINIDDGNGNGGFHRPLKVEPHLNMVLEGRHWINVMFSTEQKVNERWQ